MKNFKVYLISLFIVFCCPVIAMLLLNCIGIVVKGEWAVALGMPFGYIGGMYLYSKLG